MKIALIKTECMNGDKASCKGEVKWIGEVKIHQGQEGEFKTQSLLVVDGPETENKENSMFCDFNADKGNWNHYKDKSIAIQGTVNIYNNKTNLRSCKIIDQAPPQGQQPAPDATGTAKSPAPVSDTEMIQIRSMALAYAKDLVWAEQLKIGDLKSKADEFTAYIAHGKWFANATNNEPAEPNENVPDF